MTKKQKQIPFENDNKKGKNNNHEPTLRIGGG